MRFTVFLAGLGVGIVLLYQYLNADSKNTYIIGEPNASGYMAYQTVATTSFEGISSSGNGSFADTGIKSYSKGFGTHKRIASSMGNHGVRTFSGSVKATAGPVKSASNDVASNTNEGTVSIGYGQASSSANTTPTSSTMPSSFNNISIPNNSDVQSKIETSHGFYAMANTSSTASPFAESTDTRMLANNDLGGPEDEGEDLGNPIPVGEGFWILTLLSILYVLWKKRQEVADKLLYRLKQLSKIIKNYFSNLVEIMKLKILQAYYNIRVKFYNSSTFMSIFSIFRKMQL